MSPEYSKRTIDESPVELERQLGSEFQVTELEPGIGFEIPPVGDQYPEMGNCSKPLEDGRINQSLRAILKIGDEFLSIVDITIVKKSADKSPPQITSAIAVTHHEKGERASLVSYMGEGLENVVIGRDLQGLGRTVSRDHMSFHYEPGCYITALDHDSSNGTRVFTSRDGQPGINTDSHNPANNKNFWSLDSAGIINAFYPSA